LGLGKICCVVFKIAPFLTLHRQSENVVQIGLGCLNVGMAQHRKLKQQAEKKEASLFFSILKD